MGGGGGRAVRIKDCPATKHVRSRAAGAGGRCGVRCRPHMYSMRRLFFNLGAARHAASAAPPYKWSINIIYNIRHTPAIDKKLM